VILPLGRLDDIGGQVLYNFFLEVRCYEGFDFFPGFSRIDVDSWSFVALDAI